MKGKGAGAKEEEEEETTGGSIHKHPLWIELPSESSRYDCGTGVKGETFRLIFALFTTPLLLEG